MATPDYTAPTHSVPRRISTTSVDASLAPHRKAADGDHCRDRAWAGGLHLGDCQTGTAHGYL